MDIRSINAFFFPTRVLLVDDDPLYMRMLISLLSHQQADYEFSDDPVAVSHQLNVDYKPNQFLDKVISRSESRLNSANLDINIQEIVKTVYNPHRFSEISVLVTDFNMPKKTGQQLCEQLKNLPIKKLMITSEADEKLAIELLNKSIINKFIKKVGSVNSETGFIDTLQNMIQELQQSYFNEQSKVIINSILSSSEYVPACVNNPEFGELFKQIFNENDLCEYYLIDTSGSFLFISFSGVQSYLLVNTEDDRQTAIELIEYSDDPNQAVLTALKKGEKILYWDTEGEFPNTAEDQLNHVYPAKKVGDYYYSYVTDRNILNLDQDQIVSFQTYLRR